jgi:hypothetical protein
MQRRFMVVSAFLAALSAPLLAAAPAQGFAVTRAGTYKVKWSTDIDRVPCGAVPVPVYRTCTVKYAYSSAVSSRAGWAPAVSAASGNWCHTYDPTRSYALVYCYYNYTPNGGVGGHGVGIGALNLGGPGADGSIVLGIADYGTLTVDPLDTAWATMETPFISINTNSNISWYANANESYTVPSGYNDLQTTVTHEMGHTVGLAHPSKGPSTTGPVMQCLQATGWNHGRTDDFNGLLYIYSDRTKTIGSSPC